MVRKPRPKLTIEDLRKDSGLKHLVDVAPAHFRTVFRGPGHEVCLLCIREGQIPCPLIATVPALHSCYLLVLHDIATAGMT